MIAALALCCERFSAGTNDGQADLLDEGTCLHIGHPASRAVHLLAPRDRAAPRRSRGLRHFEQHFESLADQAFSEVAQTGEVATGMG